DVEPVAQGARAVEIRGCTQNSEGKAEGRAARQGGAEGERRRHLAIGLRIEVDAGDSELEAESGVPLALFVAEAAVGAEHGLGGGAMPGDGHRRVVREIEPEEIGVVDRYLALGCKR